jgi:murein tripeptide amidase MpaA
LQTNANSSRVTFFANDEESAGEFVLFFHQQNQQSGLLVDICSLAGLFLHMDYGNFIAANSSKAPAEKFLIIPADE